MSARWIVQWRTIEPSMRGGVADYPQRRTFDTYDDAYRFFHRLAALGVVPETHAQFLDLAIRPEPKGAAR